MHGCIYTYTSLHANITKAFPREHMTITTIIVSLIRMNTLPPLHIVLKKGRHDGTEGAVNRSS